MWVCVPLQIVVVAEWVLRAIRVEPRPARRTIGLG
jgi:hypothetical protein